MSQTFITFMIFLCLDKLNFSGAVVSEYNEFCQYLRMLFSSDFFNGTAFRITCCGSCIIIFFSERVKLITQEEY